MVWRLKYVMALGAVLTLVACGGGGGGATPATTPAQTPSAVAMTPPVLTATADVGVSVFLASTAQANFTTSGAVYVVVVDSQSVTTKEVFLTSQGGAKYYVSMKTSPSLAAGRYTGNFEVRFCPVANCAQQFPGSPQNVPYDITIGTVPNLTPLSRLPGLTDWETHQGNAAHNGYVPGAFNAAQFTTRWRWRMEGKVSAPVIANDKLYVSMTVSGDGSSVRAFKESDGMQVWKYKSAAGPLADTFYPPAVSGAAVYATTWSPSETALSSFSANDGALRFSTRNKLVRYPSTHPPTIFAGKLYTTTESINSTGHGLQSFDSASGAALWLSELGNDHASTPAVDTKYVYAVTQQYWPILSAADAGSGKLATKTTGTGPRNLQGYVPAVPVLVGNGSVLSRFGKHEGYLSLFQPASASVTWIVEGRFVTDPVVAGDTVFIANSSPKQLEARSLTTGALLWTWPLDGTFSYFVGNLVATDSHVFLSTQAATLAIDKTTHLPTSWVYPKPGEKAISANGVLYIVTLAGSLDQMVSDGGVTAINLR